jgi:hypothetical protein
MKFRLMLLAIFLALSGCYTPNESDTDRYMRTHEPKTGGTDL